MRVPRDVRQRRTTLNLYPSCTGASRAHVVLRRQGSLAQHGRAAPPGFVGQTLQTLPAQSAAPTCRQSGG